MQRRICLRADASATIGYGHFVRTLALVDMLKDTFDCVFYTVNPSPYQITELMKECSYVSLSEKTKFEDFLSYLDGTEIVVLDNYFFTTDYQRSIKAKGCKLVCIDDMHDKHYVADAVINHGTARPDEFDCEPYTRLCLGEKWALLRKPFIETIQKRKRKKQIVVCFGGSDPQRLTDKIVTYLLELSVNYEIVVVLGDAAYLSEENRNRVTIMQNLTAKQMANLFETSIIGIMPASSVRIEAVSRGLKVISGYYVDNQQIGFERSLSKKDIIPVYNFKEITLEQLRKALYLVEEFSFKIPDYTNVPDNYIKLMSTL